MAEARTRPTAASVGEYLASRATPAQLAICKVLMSIFERVTKVSPRMWGPSIVGYGSYRYRYESERTGGNRVPPGSPSEVCELVVYLVAESPRQQALPSKLGTHKIGAALTSEATSRTLIRKCFRNSIANAIAEVRRRYPDAGDA